ncbi:MAG: AbrB family transcriptional regulator [Dethiosulfatibacter sp.]|nr:AbrB family transcriptional regulator [Dethiosulfatibacter sp.]
MINLSITLVVAIFFGVTALKLKIPAGALLGAILGVALLNSLTDLAYFPYYIKTFSTSLIGAYIGCRISIGDLRQIKTIIKPSLFMILVMIGYNLISSKILSLVSCIDFYTAFLALAPGGVTDMTLLAMDIKANASIVSTVQMIRLLSIIGFTPFIIKYSILLSDRIGYGCEHITELSQGSNEIAITKSRNLFFEFRNTKTYRIVLTLAIGILSGILGKLSNLPAGILCFSICGVAVFNIFTNQGYLPLSLRRFAQILSGTLIGLRFSHQELLEVWNSIVPVMIIILGWMLLNQVLGIIISRWVKIPLVTALFSSSAGGLTDMGIIASEMGGNAALITSFQLSRLLSVLLLYPIIIQSILALTIVRDFK